MKSQELNAIKEQWASNYNKTWKDIQKDFEYGLGVSKLYSFEEVMDIIAEQYAQSRESELKSEMKKLKAKNETLKSSAEILLKGLEHIGKWGDEEQERWDDPGSCALDTITQYRYSLTSKDV